MLETTIFEFSSYVLKPAEKQVVFHYKTSISGGGSLNWTETILLPKVPELNHISKPLLEKLLQSLHIIIGISYYKAYLGEVKLPYKLSKQEAEFWNTVYKKGLGEFFYKNNLDPRISPKFPFSKTTKLWVTGYGLPVIGRSLVGIGGGKDSIVSAELLKDAGFDFDSFVIQTNEDSALVDKIVDLIGVRDLKVKRVLDPKIFEKHPYNGHIPISAIYAFLGIFACALYGYKYFIVSNEHSSNFGNIKYKGLEINHQWSKSFEFEKLFQEYTRNSISPDVTYFSLLRPFSELRIAKMFARYPKYFEHFSSCNSNFKFKKESGGLWCGICAKCVFVFTLLSAFLSKKELLDMFGKNLYEDRELLPLFKDVLGLGNMKPFDCVGTFDEAQTALYMAKSKFKDSFIVRQIGSKVRLHKEVFETNKDSNIPEQFKFLGMEKALILGYGKEGKVTKQYLKKYYPKLKIGVGDESLDKNYLKKQKNFDIAIKTPGVNKKLLSIPYTTATNIFFSHIKGRNTIIGVTGSKGKSTTSSLIHHILKTAGKDAKLLGNIGKPMLETLLNPVPKSRIFVLELSSFQLDDIRFSPDIAVVTNLFPEHVDFHGSLKNYYEAKKNILKTAEHFIYSPKNSIMRQWAKNYQGKPIVFSKKKYSSNLLGGHNQDNIGAAVSVANILQIPAAKIKEAIKTFKSLPHRLEFVGEFKGIKFYDDAISTTPESTIMALKTIQDVDTIFLGGQNREYNFSQLEKAVKRYKVKNIVLFPDSGNKMLKNKKGLNILRTKSMKEAVAFAYKNTKQGGVCLLSCASPSYSLWKNFEEKGDKFQKFVKQLGKK